MAAIPPRRRFRHLPPLPSTRSRHVPWSSQVGVPFFGFADSKEGGNVVERAIKRRRCEPAYSGGRGPRTKRAGEVGTRAWPQRFFSRDRPRPICIWRSVSVETVPPSTILSFPVAGVGPKPSYFLFGSLVVRARRSSANRLFRGRPRCRETRPASTARRQNRTKRSACCTPIPNRSEASRWLKTRRATRLRAVISPTTIPRPSVPRARG